MINVDTKHLLLVPIKLSAFIESSKNFNNIANISLAYNNLKDNDNLTGDSINIHPFAMRSGNGWFGVHLHWALPDALTHSKEGGDGNKFPDVPNRWLIQRYFECDGKIERKVWVVESDFYTTSKSKDMVTGPDVFIPNFQLNSNGTYSWQGGKRYAWLGRCYTLGGKKPLREGSDGYLDSLTAIGSGSPIFSSSYQQCASVFGFYDKLEGIENAKISYQVTGWFSRLSDDPINIAGSLSDCLAQNNWIVEGGDGVDILSSLYHGRLNSLDWRGVEAEYPTDMPKADDFTLGFGNSSQEVLSAILADGNPELERVLQILQSETFKCVENPDGLINMEEKLHAEQFSSVYGGKIWQVTSNKAEREKHSNLLKSINKKLKSLNDSETNIENLMAKLVKNQEECNAIWYMYINAKHSDDVEEIASITDLVNLLQEKCEQISTIKDSLNDEFAEHFQLKGKNENICSKADFNIEKISKPRFYEPLTPVVMIKGKGLRYNKHGEDGRHRDDNLLDCRISTDIVSSVVIKVNGESFNFNKSNLKEVLPISLNKLQNIGDIPDLPKNYNDYILSIFDNLFFEALILDDGLEEFLIKAIAKSDLLHNDNQYIKIFNGKPSSPIDKTIWHQPWEPMLLDWKVELAPFRTFPNGNYESYVDDTLSMFNFGDIDYESPKKPPRRDISKIILDGETIITPHAAHLLQERLDRAIEEFPKIAEILKINVKDLELLSQALTGFNERLIMRKTSPQLPIHDTSSPDEDLIKKVIEALKPVRQDNHEKVASVAPHFYSTYSDIESSSFLPLRGCEVSLSAFRIVDSFGQVLNLSKCKKVIPSSMKASYGEPEKAILKPRVNQATRFDFRWIAANNNNIDSNGDIETSPILAFVLPSFLDGCITLFDELGACIGKIKEVFFSEVPSTIWQKEGEGAEKVDDIQNQHVKEFVKELMSSEDNKGASNFSQFMKYIQEELSNVAPESSSEPVLSQFFGRPLVLARLRLSVSLREDVASSNEFKYFQKNIDFSYYKSAFNFYLGDSRKLNDGLLGVFKGEKAEKTYKKFFTRWGANEKGTFFSVDKNIQLTAEKDFNQYLTALLDPLASVHALSGILPSKSITLPEIYYQSIINNLEISFNANSLIMDENNFSLPIPCGDDEKLWRWSMLNDTSEHKNERTFPITELDYSKIPQNLKVFDGKLVRYKTKK